MKSKILGIITVGLFVSTVSFASAIVKMDKDKNVLTVKGEIVFYGPKASEEVAQKATTEVQTYWNGGTNAAPAPQYFVTLVNGKKFQVMFEITHQVVNDADAAAMMKNPRVEQTFIQVLQGDAAKGDRSYMEGLGSNKGVWYLSDNLGASTTAPHEYGHGLGLDHPVLTNWIGRGQPGIMCARGFIVDPEYQYTPAAKPGQPGGTISPYKRKIIQWDINNLQLSKLKYDANSIANLNIPRGETPWSKDPTESKMVQAPRPRHVERIY